VSTGGHLGHSSDGLGRVAIAAGIGRGQCVLGSSGGHLG
jgi:hypothetical protein